MAETMCRLILNNYNKMQDHIGFLGKEYVVKMGVKLFTTDKDGNRHPFYNEYVYKDKNNPNFIGITIDRRYQPYIVIESTKKDEDGRKFQMMIIQDDMYYVRRILHGTESWFFENKNKIFAMNRKSKKMFIMGDSDHRAKIILKYGGYLEIEPSIREDNHTGEQLIGVIVTLSSDSIRLFLKMDDYLAFVDTVCGCRLHEMAMEMIASMDIKMGTNIKDLRGSSSSFYSNGNSNINKGFKFLKE